MNTYKLLDRATPLGKKKDRAVYAYSATRTRAMSSKLLTENDYAKFLKMDINEIIRFLEEHEYKREIDSIGAKASKISYLEQVLNENFASTINKMFGFAPKDSPIWAYTMKYDIANLKTIIRGIASRRSRAEILRNLIFVGSLKKDFLKNLVDKSNRKEVIGAFRGMLYYNLLRENENKNLEEFEDSLDRFYYEKLLDVSKAQKDLQKVIKLEIDAKNVLTLFRLKKAKISKVESFLIKGGNLKIKKLKGWGAFNEFELMRILKRYYFWKYAPEGTKELDKIEAGLRKFIVLSGSGLLKDYRPSFSTLLGFIIAKEREINNIRMVARSKLSKNPEDALNIKSKLYVR